MPDVFKVRRTGTIAVWIDIYAVAVLCSRLAGASFYWINTIMKMENF